MRMTRLALSLLKRIHSTYSLLIHGSSNFSLLLFQVPTPSLHSSHATPEKTLPFSTFCYRTAVFHFCNGTAANSDGAALFLLIPALQMGPVPPPETPSSSMAIVSGGGSLAAQGSIATARPLSSVRAQWRWLPLFVDHH